MENKDLLPIGTVVLLKNGEKRVMITGFNCSCEENLEELFTRFVSNN